METVAVRAERDERLCKRGFVLVRSNAWIEWRAHRKSLRCTDHGCTLTATTSSRRSKQHQPEDQTYSS
eukprot:4482803-Prymnesium_polylepis.1